jgi:hypothetical protein
MSTCSASSFNCQHILVCSRSSSSCLRFLPRLPVPSIFHSITSFRRQFLRKMWPIQLAFYSFYFMQYASSVRNILLYLIYHYHMYTRRVHQGFMVDIVALRHVIPPVVRFSRHSSFHQYSLCIHTPSEGQQMGPFGATVPRDIVSPDVKINHMCNC